MQNKRIILCGPSACGKNYIRERFVEKGYSIDVSYTSREKRLGEIDGLDYKFLSKEQFEKKIQDGEFYEWVQYNDNYYGTGLREFYTNEVFIMETDGIKHIKTKDRLTSLVIFVNTPEDIRIKRMKEERKWNDETINKRIKTDHLKFDNFTDYDLMIIS